VWRTPCSCYNVETHWNFSWQVTAQLKYRLHTPQRIVLSKNSAHILSNANVAIWSVEQPYTTPPRTFQVFQDLYEPCFSILWRCLKENLDSNSNLKKTRILEKENWTLTVTSVALKPQNCSMNWQVSGNSYKFEMSARSTFDFARVWGVKLLISNWKSFFEENLEFY